MTLITIPFLLFMNFAALRGADEIATILTLEFVRESTRKGWTPPWTGTATAFMESTQRREIRGNKICVKASSSMEWRILATLRERIFTFLPLT